MKLLSVLGSAKRVKLTVSKSGDRADFHELPTFVELSIETNRIASRFAELIADPFWRLEYCKLIAADGFAALGLAKAIAETAKPNGKTETFGPVFDERRVLFACAYEFARRGVTVAGLRRMRLLMRLRFCISTVIAVLAWSWTVVRYGSRAHPPALAANDVLVSIHGEISNRTRHVLAAAGQATPCPAIIILGRPTESLASLKVRFSSQFGIVAPTLHRPISIGSALRSLPDLFKLVGSGINISSDTGFKPRWRDEIAVLYRMCAGSCATAWWAQQSVAAGAVIYGQSGLADTSMLERAQQETGCKTVHWVHGLTGGWNFAGYSDLGLFQCGHDADLHSRLPEYGETGFLALPRPDYCPGKGRNWLLLTNYAHPSNPFHSHGAVDFEIEVIRMAAEAALKSDAKPENLIWRPHPAFWSLAEATRARVLASLKGTGITLSGPGSDPPHYADYQTILCTLSTVALDVLIAGSLPVIVAPHALNPDTAYVGFPFHAADSDQLAAAADALSDSATAASSYEDTWDRIRPGTAGLTLDQIVDRLNV